MGYFGAVMLPLRNKSRSRKGSVRMNAFNFLSTAGKFPMSGVENLASDASFTDRLLYGLKFAAIGIVVVFLILLILWAVLFVFNLVYKVRKGKADEKVEETAAPVNSSTASENGELDEQTVAAIATAAIAAARGESDCAFDVISITKVQK